MSLPNAFYTVKKNNRTLEIDVGNIPFERVNTNKGKSSSKRHWTSEGLKALKKCSCSLSLIEFSQPQDMGIIQPVIQMWKLRF